MNGGAWKNFVVAVTAATTIAAGIWALSTIVNSKADAAELREVRKDISTIREDLASLRSKFYSLGRHTER